MPGPWLQLWVGPMDGNEVAQQMGTARLVQRAEPILLQAGALPVTVGGVLQIGADGLAEIRVTVAPDLLESAVIGILDRHALTVRQRQLNEGD